MAIIGDALGQAFMPIHHNPHILRRDHKPWRRLIILLLAAALFIAIVVSASVSLTIVFPGESNLRPLCRDRRIQALPMVEDQSSIDSYHGAFYLTDAEAADYYWMVVFLPSAIVFLVSSVYLVSGMIVAYSASARHPCLKVVENNYCASRRGGVRCLAILNIVFAIIFGLMAVFLGSSLLSLGSSCSVSLFWCYEIASWGLVILYGFTAFMLIRKKTDDDRDLGLELSESIVPVQVITPEMERCVHEGFKSWMGSSILSSDDEDEGPDDYLEERHPILGANYQRE